MRPKENSRYDRKVKAKKTTGKKENPIDKLTALLNEEIAPKLDTPRTERRAFQQYRKASVRLKRLARVLSEDKWTDHPAKVAREKA
jgi:chromosome segregation ATPase